MPKVIVVPETEEYQFDVSHKNLVWITKKLGVPKLKDRDVSYLAPLWIGEPQGVTRIFHIVDWRDIEHATEIEIGNSFRLKKTWNEPGQRRRFEYEDLSVFGFHEIEPGLLRES